MRRVTLALIILWPLLSLGQTYNSVVGDESVLYAQTKQVGQFFRRFNGEEDVQGNRLTSGEKFVRDPKLRKKYLPILFDLSNPSLNKDLKDVFINQVTNAKAPIYLDFHNKDWFAEVNCTFLYKGQKANLIIFLRIEKQDQGYKWVFSNVYFNKYEKWFQHVGDTSNNKLILHPMSHELDFMNINKVFRDEENLDYYLERNYQPDFMSIFVEDVKNGNLKFDAVNNVKFHFFQVKGWYFELSYFNRNENNSGWLISNLLNVNEKEKRELIRNYSHDTN